MRTSRLLAAVTAAAAAVTVLAACGSSADDDKAAGTTSSTDRFPVTVEHVYGATTIESKPQRVATVAWANHEVPLALGVVPVGMSKATWGDDDDDGVLPWVEDKLTELGAKTPVLFDETDGIDFEAVADTHPDVILAAYSGLTQEEYETLSKIAPTVAYPKLAWGTSVQDMIRLDSRAIGLADEGEKLVADLDKQTEETFAKYPQLAGKSIIFTYLDPKDLSQIGYYTTHDTRPGFLHALGMGVPKVVADGSAKSEGFYETISSEKADELDDADILVTYGPADGSIQKAAKADPLLSKVRAVQDGSIALLEDSTPLAASANPSPLSIGWGLDKYLALLAAAADKVQ
ncbi:iron-siderophore ABC transporter substrate-binding protein [Marmoricola sp. RAF53]|uniref:iron-siderophore ABC transporter substrate-binding protein n=1 Tax=Marmoricola sp. RAF53 TaxID=3233059 RepID=UPI003F97EA3F